MPRVPVRSVLAILSLLAVPSTGASQESAESFMSAAQAAVVLDDYPAAQAALAKAAAAAKGDPAAAADIADARKEVGALQKAFAKLAKARDALEKSPDDPAANDAVGRFYAFAKGDWDRGLPPLARSPDGPVKSAATLELRRPADIDTQVKLGDLWREVADSDRDENAVSCATLRARYWYLSAAEVLSDDAERRPIFAKLDLLRLYPTKIVVVNSHNGHYNDRGTLLADLKLLLDGKVVLTRRLTLPWKMGESVPLTVRVPRTQADAIQVDVLKWKGLGGALAEIEAYQEDVNLARDGAAEASTIHNVQFGAELISDGDYGDKDEQTGSWVLPDNEPGWVRVYLDRP